MRLLPVVVAGAAFARPLTIGRMAGRTQSLQEGMAPASPRAPPARPLTNEGLATPLPLTALGSPGRVEELDRRFEEERRGWERRARRIGCEGEEDEGRHEDGSRTDPRGDVVVNGVEGAEEGGVAPIDPVFEFDFERRGGLIEDSGEGSTTGTDQDIAVIAPGSRSRTGSAYRASARASINCRVPVVVGGRHRVHLPPILGRR